MSTLKDRGDRERRRPRAAGFTLTELMVVLIVLGILAGIAIFGARRPLAESQLDSAMGAFRGTVMAARQRAVTSNQVYLVEIAPAQGFRYCVALSDLSACATTEVSAWTHVGEKVVFDSYAKSTVFTGTTGAVSFAGGTVRLVVRRDGSVDGDPTTPTLDGFTLFLRTDDQAKRRKAYLYPLTGQMRITDAW
jgi:prepilin-type N-terminal cleavage/methylation domain-containing protein